MQYGNRNRNRSREEKNTQRKVITHERERAINLDPGKIPRVVGTTRTRLLRLPCATTRTKEVLVVCYKPWYKNISFLCHWSKLLPKGAKTTTASGRDLFRLHCKTRGLFCVCERKAHYDIWQVTVANFVALAQNLDEAFAFWPSFKVARLTLTYECERK